MLGLIALYCAFGEKTIVAGHLSFGIYRRIFGEEHLECADVAPL